MTFSHFLALILTTLAAASAASAEFVAVPAFLFNGDGASDSFGVPVRGAGDVNNDGFADLIIGAALDDNNGTDSGTARVFSGAAGAILYTWNGDGAGDNFGAVSGAGDVNNDGFADLIVGAQFDDNNGTNSGSARVFSGATGAILYTWNGDDANDQFGGAVSGAGDVNNDGFDDLIVGALDDNNGFNAGSARVFSGATGAILYTWNGDGPNEWFGFVSGAGDVNNDGFADVIVGAPGDGFTPPGSARVFSGATGAILYTWNGDGTGDRFGISVSGAGDVNNDGFADLIVGTDQDDNNGANSGSARVYSGATGAILYTWNGDGTGDLFGHSVSGAGDVNNDGFADLIVGAPLDDNTGSGSGSACVFSGATGAILSTFNGDGTGDAFGYSVSGAGDVNNDNLADLIVGAWFDDNGGTNSGSARVFISAACPPPAVPCPGDADGNLAVNFTDVTSVLANFNLTCPAGAPFLAIPAFLFNGDGAGDSFGVCVNGAGDVNFDGFDDLIVGAIGDDNNGADSGSARVLSGASGAVLYTWSGDGAGDNFGRTASGAGDVNNDGFADLIVGAPGDDNNGTNSGSASVFSGANGAILYTWNGDGATDNFGASSGAGDVNNDGFADLIVGAYQDDNNGANSGSARVFSGATGAILYTWNGDGANDLFGFSVRGAGDVNNDGFDDLIVGAVFDDNNGIDTGSARVFSGATGATLYTWNGDGANDRFGWSVSGAGDVNNDGFDDLIVGAYQDDNSGTDSGSVRVFSGATGAILYTWNGDGAGDNFGFSVSGAGDVNNDGFDDLIVGAVLDDNNGTDSGSARVFSGATGAILSTFSGGGAADQFGNAVSAAGDVNNDGFPDLIVGANLDDNSGTNSGSVRVILGAVATCLPSTPCPGDADGNFAVNFTDITGVLANFNLTCP